MVLSDKKLKRTRRGDSAQNEDSVQLVADDSKSISKREKKRRRRQQLEIPQAVQSASSESPIDQAELEAYHRCIERVLSKKGLSTSLDGEDAPTPPHVHEKKSQDAEENVAHSADKSTGKKYKHGPNASNPDDLVMQNAESTVQKKVSKTNARKEETDEQAVKNRAENQDSDESRTVYVGGIPYYSSEDDIKSFFRDCGTISEVSLKTFSDSGKFRGIALLTFKTLGGAQRALALDGSTMGDRFLKIQRATAKTIELPKTEGYSGPPTKTEGYMRAYVGNLSWNVTEEDIRSFFKGCKIDRVNFCEDKVTGAFRGFGHVDFADDESLEQALQLDQHLLLERPIKVAYAVPNKAGKRVNFAPRDKKDIICHTCGEKGHVSSCCPYMGRGQ